MVHMLSYGPYVMVHVDQGERSLKGQINAKFLQLA